MKYVLRKRTNIPNYVEEVLELTTSAKKRKRLDSPTSPNKKIKTTNIATWELLNKYVPVNNLKKSDNASWVSASSTQNYLMEDPIIDWLELYWNSKQKTKISLIGRTDCLVPLFELGNNFEKNIINYLKSKYPNDIKIVCKNYDDIRNKELSKLTIEHMKNGIKIISQAMLVNDNNRTFGIADLLIRSDFVNELFKNSVLNDQEKIIKSPVLKDNYHYVVIDIKYSQMTLSVNGKNIQNTEKRHKAYKGQLAVYNLALGNMQNYIPNKAYILSKDWKINNKANDRCYDSFDRLCEINYNDYDNEILKLTTEAINWVRDVRVNGRDWSCFDPKRSEMYPNMCIQNQKWNKVKSLIADEVKELTQFWMVGKKNRDVAFDKNIRTWDDVNCTATNLNINGKMRAPILNKLLEVNKSDHLILPKKITNNDFDWQNESDLDFYIDFELLNECFVNSNIDVRNSKKLTNIISFIGIFYKEDGVEKYKSFELESFSLEQENKIIKEFIKFIDDKKNIYKNKTKKYLEPKLYHWSQIEETTLKTAILRQKIDPLWLNKVQFVDMYEIFLKEPIVIKNMYKFSLKNVISAMYKNDMLKVQWDDAINDGFEAMIDAGKYYKNINNGNIKSNVILDNIRKYNRVDCEAIYQIVNYLRKNNL